MTCDDTLRDLLEKVSKGVIIIKCSLNVETNSYVFGFGHMSFSLNLPTKQGCKGKSPHAPQGTLFNLVPSCDQQADLKTNSYIFGFGHR